MCGGVGFGEVVRKVGVSSFPKDDELALLDAILNPVESHDDGFGAALLEIHVGNTSSGSVFSVKGGGWLFLYHFFKGSTEDGAILGIEEDPSNFGFGFQVHDVLDDGGDGVDGSVVGGGIL